MFASLPVLTYLELVFYHIEVSIIVRDGTFERHKLYNECTLKDIHKQEWELAIGIHNILEAYGLRN